MRDAGLALRHGAQVRHEGRKILEVTPEAKQRRDGFVDGDCLLDVNTGASSKLLARIGFQIRDRRRSAAAVSMSWPLGIRVCGHHTGGDHWQPRCPSRCCYSHNVLPSET